MKLTRAFAPIALAASITILPQTAFAHDPEELADLVDTVSEATVNVTILKNVAPTQGDDVVPPNSPFPFLEEFNDNGSGEPALRAVGVGSGFVIDATNCYVVTNNHVAEGGDGFLVTFPSGHELSAEIVGRDPKTDLAVLKTECDVSLTTEVDWGDSDIVRRGHDVFAIGNPQGLSNTVTKGIVSALNRDINSGPYDQFIQTDTSINQGNSGGALFNMDGDVIGVNTAIFSRSGGSNGLGFAIPSNVANHVTDQLIKYGEVRRGWLGVQIQGINQAVADDLGLADTSGALVADVTEDGPADLSGIEQGDVIIEFNGKTVETSRDLPRIVALTPIGEDVDVKVIRDGQEVTLNVQIGDLKTLEDAQAQQEAQTTEPEAAPELAPDLTPEREAPLPEPETDIPPQFRIPNFTPQ